MPRYRQLFHALVVSALLAGSAEAQQQGIRWQQDVELAKNMARQSGRLVLVHVWTPSCGPCRALEQNVFNQPGVAGALETYYVPVKLNADQFPAAAQALGIARVPTDVVLTADGQIVGKMISPATPAAYVAELTQVATRLSANSQPYTNAAAAAPVPPQMNAAYANLPIDPALAETSSSPWQMNQSAVALAQSPPVSGGGAGLPTASAITPTAPPAPSAAGPTANQYAMPSPVGQPQLPIAQQPPAMPMSPTPSQTVNPYAYAAAPTATAGGAVSNPDAAEAAAPASSGVVPGIAPQSPPAPPMVADDLAGVVVTPDGRRLPPGAPPLGFEGYCPVSMRNQWTWVAGDPRWGAIHRGRTYWFSGQTEQQQFLANPDYYGPVLSGIDPVLAIDHHQAVPGQREHSLDYDNQFYLFSSEATLQQFTSNPERYATGVRQAMGIQPGRLIR